MAIAALTGPGRTWQHGWQVGKQLECSCGHEPPCQFWQKAWGGEIPKEILAQGQAPFCTRPSEMNEPDLPAWTQLYDRGMNRMAWTV